MTLLSFEQKHIVTSEQSASTTSTSFVDDPYATLSFTLDSPKVALIIYQTTNHYGSTISTAIRTAIEVNDVNLSEMYDTVGTNNYCRRNFVFWLGTLEEGSYTVKGKFCCQSSGTVTIDFRTLLVILFDGDEYYFKYDSTPLSTSRTSFIDDEYTQTTFTPSGNCKILALYAVRGGSSDISIGIKIALNKDGTDYSQTERGGGKTYLCGVTAYAYSSSVNSNTIVGRVASNQSGISTTYYERYLGILCLSDNTLLDMVNTVNQISTSSTDLVDDPYGTVSRELSDLHGVFVLAIGTKRHSTDSLGGRYAIQVNTDDVSYSRCSTSISTLSTSAPTAYVTSLEAGVHTIKGRFSSNSSGTTAVWDARIIIVLWFPSAFIEISCSEGLTVSDIRALSPKLGHKEVTHVVDTFGYRGHIVSRDVSKISDSFNYCSKIVSKEISSAIDTLSYCGQCVLKEVQGIFDVAILEKALYYFDCLEALDLQERLAIHSSLKITDWINVFDRTKVRSSIGFVNILTLSDLLVAGASVTLPEVMSMYDRTGILSQELLLESLSLVDTIKSRLITSISEGVSVKDGLINKIYSKLYDSVGLIDRLKIATTCVFKDTNIGTDCLITCTGICLKELGSVVDIYEYIGGANLLEIVKPVETLKVRHSTELLELAKLSDAWVRIKEVLSEEALSLIELPLVLKAFLSIPEEIPACKVYNETSGIEVTGDVIRLKINKSRGLVTDWEIELAKPDLYTNYFNTSDVIKIYLGYGNSLVNVCSGLCYVKDVSEDSIRLKGFDFGDYLVGPNVSVEFYDEDWGSIIKRLITLYVPILDTSEIEATGYKTGGRIIFENTTLLDAVLTAVDGLRLSSNTDWLLEITPNLKVKLIKRPLKPTITVDERLVEGASYSKDQSIAVNKVVITGDKERIHDDFDTSFLKSDYWRAEAGANYWESSGPPNYDLYYLGSSANEAGQLFTAIKCFNSELDFPVKQSVVSSGSPFEFSIYLRTNIGTLDTLGYRVRMYGPDSNDKHWVYIYRNGQLVASRDLSTLSTPLSYTSDTYYLANIKLAGGSLSVSIKEQPVIEYYDPEPLTLGRICLLAPTGKDTVIDYFRLDTDTPIWAMSEDLVSQEKIGIKQVTLLMPEICLIKEAERMASLELAKRKFESTRVELTALGTLRIGVGDVITLELPEPEISGDYLILDQEQTYEEGHWTTKYNLAMIMPRLVEILAGLRTAYLKKVPTTGIPRNARLTDAIPIIIDTIRSIYVEGTNKVGESAVGMSYEYA